jgi:hypothetical protein
MYGFIVTRRVIDDITNQYWIQSYNCIRAFYNNPILIIDDKSNEQYITNDIELVNCTIIKNTDYPGSGELGAYFYFRTLRPFDKAVILHDSVFIQSYIDFDTICNINFLWSFDSICNDIVNYKGLLARSKLSNEHRNKIWSDDTWWRGCFGVMSVISYDFLEKIDNCIGLTTHLIKYVNTRTRREMVERVFAIACHLVKPDLLYSPSIFGDILKYCPWGVTYNDYKTGKYANLPIVKVWTGR